MPTFYTLDNVYDPAGSMTTGGNNLLTAMVNFITQHPGWTVVEDVNPGTASTFRWVALKCSAAYSGLPADFFVLLVYNIPNYINAYVGEAYTAGSARTLTKYAPNPSSSTYTPAADTTVPGTMTANASSGAPTTSTVNPWPVSLPVQAANTYQAAVYDDHLFLSSYLQQQPTGQSGYYLGAFTSLVTNPAVNDPMPLVSVSTNANTSWTYNGASTRTPMTTATAGTNYWLVGPPGLAPGSNGYQYIWSTPFGYNFPYNVGDPYSGNSGQPVAEALVSMYGGLSGTTATGTRGVLRGKYNAVRLMMFAPTGTQVGDTFSINGTRWAVVMIGQSNNYILIDTGVAG